MPHWRGLLQLLTLFAVYWGHLSRFPQTLSAAQIQGIPTPWIYVNIANLSSYDAMNNDVAGQPLNGQNGQNPSKLGAKFNHSLYVDRTVGLVLLTWDALTNSIYVNGAALTGLNGGTNNNFSTVIYWGGAYSGDGSDCNLPAPVITFNGGVYVITNTSRLVTLSSIAVTFDGSEPPCFGLGILGNTSLIPYNNGIAPAGAYSYDGPFTLPWGNPANPVTIKAKGYTIVTAGSATATLANQISLGNNWSNNVVSNGGSAPSVNSETNIDAFGANLNNYGLSLGNPSQALSIPAGPPGPVAINIMATDSVIAAMSPIIYVKGPPLWTNNNFVLADLTVNGLKGNGTSKSITTGILANNSTLVNTSSLSLYNYVNQSHAGNVELHAAPDASGNNEFALFAVRNTGSGFASLYNEGNGFVTGTMTANFQGFQTASRIGTGTASANMWVGNSSVTFTNIGVNNNSATLGSPVAQFMTVFAANLGGTIGDWSSNTISYVSIFQGHNTSASSNEFRLVQLLKQGQGGGFR